MKNEKLRILGLQELRKPLCHLLTQFNEEIPYDTIDMDFMNENQSAQGDVDALTDEYYDTCQIQLGGLKQLPGLKNELRWNEAACK